MASDDTLTLIGNLTRDPELKYTNGGQAVVNFTVARTNRRKNPDTDEWEEGSPGFYDCTLWGQAAENLAESMTKGMRIIVYGQLQFDRWEDKDTGKNRSAVRVRANEVGASLRWTTAEVEQRERNEAPRRQAPVHNYADEEPF